MASEFQKKVFNYSTAYVVEQLSAGYPKKDIQCNLAYALEARFGLDMITSISASEMLMTKMPDVMKKMEALAEERSVRIDEAMTKAGK